MGLNVHLDRWLHHLPKGLDRRRDSVDSTQEGCHSEGLAVSRDRFYGRRWVQFTVAGHYDCSVDDFWSKVFFEPDFNTFLYGAHGLDFPQLEILEEEVFANGGRTRVLKAHPKVNAPGPLKRVFGPNIHYIENGHMDLERMAWVTRILIPSVGQKIALSGDMSFHPTGENTCVRRMVFDLEVKIFGVGRLAERFVKSALQENYELARVVTNRWIRDHL